MVIEEIERDSSFDYTKILRGLMELPFNVGRNLLCEFLQGSYTNKSILKNNLDNYHSFGTLHWDKSEILKMIEKLINNRMIEEVAAEYNSFIKVLSITMKGRSEIAIPTLHENKPVMKIDRETNVTDGDRERFVDYSEFLEGFNDEQKKAIIADGKSVLTIAGAGSGKTTVLVKRIEYLVNYKKVLPEEILAITFTRKAREEMEKRLLSLGIRGVLVSTFNSFCENILRKSGAHVYGKRVRVLGYADKVLAMNLAMYNLDIELEDAVDVYFSNSMKKRKSMTQLQNILMNDCFSVLDYFRVTGQEMYDLSRDVDPKDVEMATMVYKIVQYLAEHKRSQGLRGFVDQLVDVVEFFRKGPAEIPYFDHVLVDEYQDVNAMQVELLELINKDHIFAVGDPRQSIFGWRGSDVTFIQRFAEHFGDTITVHLLKNYRSNKGVVDFMNLAISSMKLPDLEHHNEGKTNLKLFSFDNEEAERMFLLQVIEGLVVADEDVFVLARTNRQLFDFSDSLRRKGIDFVIKTDDSFGAAPKKEEAPLNSKLILATVHAIKGLEAKHVFVIGCNKDSFPCRASDHPIVEMIKSDYYDKDEEERRLFYVAISRARENLYMTYTGTVTHFITDEMKDILEKD
ncbi:MAG: superfamily I DNA/RNA helicase [Patescibacteria group bacterium]|jgi:superfamily I DNA/RNA helicase